MSSETDGAPPRPVVELISDWKKRGCPAQHAIVWPRRQWIATFPSQRSFLESLPDFIAREDVRAVAGAAARDTSGAIEAFLASMAWGYGSVGYGPWRTERVLRINVDAPHRLHHVAGVVSKHGAVAGYRCLANEDRLRHLGPAFGTKFLHFVPQASGEAVGLIHDAVVSRSIHAHGGPQLSAASWSTATYTQFVRTMTSWAAELDIEPADLETQLFSAKARGQWAR